MRTKWLLIGIGLLVGVIAIAAIACDDDDENGGQGMMVRVADGFETVDDLATATICVLQGTTLELNLADRLPDSIALSLEDNETLQAAFIEERCDGWTSDKSQLASRRFAFPESAGGPDSLVILDETFSSPGR